MKLKKRKILTLVFLALAIAGAVLWILRPKYPEVKLQRAELALRKKNLKQAEVLINEYLNKRPRSLRGLLVKANVLFTQGRFAECVATCQRAMQFHPDSPKPYSVMARALMGEAHYRSKNLLEASGPDAFLQAQQPLQQAESAIVAFINSHPNQPTRNNRREWAWMLERLGRVRDFRGWILLQRARWNRDAAVKDRVAGLRDRAEQHSRNAERFTNEANALIDSAIQTLKQAQQVAPKVPGAVSALLRIYQRRNNPQAITSLIEQTIERGTITENDVAVGVDAALQQFRRLGLAEGRQLLSRVKVTVEKFLKSHLQSPLARTKLATLQIELNQWRQARTEVEKVLRSSPKFRDALFIKALLQLHEHKTNQAKQLLLQLLARDKNNTSLLYHLARAYAQANQLELSRDSYLEVLDRDPRHVYARIELARVVQQLGGVRDPATMAAAADQAEEILRNGLKLLPDDADLLAALLNVLKQRGKLKAAKQILEQWADRLDELPQRSKAALSLQFVLAGQSQRGLKIAEQVLVKSPYQFDALLAKAIALRLAGRYESCRQTLELMKTEFPDRPEVHEQQAALFAAQHRLEDAAAELAKAADCAPSNFAYRMRLAGVYLRTGMLEQASRCAKEVLRLKPDHLDALELAARVASMLGRDAEAKKYYATLEANLKRMGERDNLAASLAYYRQQWDKCVEYCNRWLLRRPDDIQYHQLAAMAYVRQGKLDMAIQQINQAIEKQPTALGLYDMLRRLYVESGRIDEAIQRFAKLQQRDFDDPALRQAVQMNAKIAIAALHYANQQYQQALEQLQAIRSEFAQQLLGHEIDVRLCRQMAECLLSQAREGTDPNKRKKLIDAALEKVSLLLQDERTAVAGRLARSDIYARCGMYKQAEAELDELAAYLKQLNPAPMRSRLALAESYRKLGRLDKAIEQLNIIEAGRPKQILTNLTKLQIYRTAAAKLQQQGDTRLARQQLVKAIDECRTAMQKRPGDVTLFSKLINLHILALDWPKALELTEQLGRLGRDGQLRALAVRGRIYASSGLFEQAVEQLQAAEQLGQLWDYEVKLLLANAYATVGQKQQARRILLEIPFYSPIYPSAQLELAKLAAAEGDASGSMRIKAELHKRFPNDENIALILAGEYLQQGMSDKLVELCTRVLDRRGRSAISRARWLAMRTVAQGNLGKWQQALADAQQCVNLSPRDSLAWCRLLSVQLILENHEQARADYSRAMHFVAAGRDPYLVLAGVLANLASNHGKQAVGLLTELEQAGQNAGLPSTKAWRVMALVAAADARHALSLAQTAENPVEVPPNDLLEWVRTATAADSGPEQARLMLMSILLRRMNWFEKAIQYCRKASQLLPDQPLPALLAIQTTQAQSDRQKSKPLVEQFVRKFPTSSAARLMQIELLSEAGRTQQALELAKKLVADQPQVGHFHFVLGGLYERLGEHEKAIDAYNRALASEPGHVNAANNLAYLLASYHQNEPARLRRAVELAKRAVERLPSRAELLDTLGWVEFLSGQDQSAARHLAQALAALPTEPEVHYHIGALYARTGRIELAKMHLKAALELAEQQGTALPQQQRARELLEKLQARGRSDERMQIHR